MSSSQKERTLGGRQKQIRACKGVEGVGGGDQNSGI